MKTHEAGSHEHTTSVYTPPLISHTTQSLYEPLTGVVVDTRKDYMAQP